MIGCIVRRRPTGQGFLLRQERYWASQGASSATELAGLAVHIYAEEEKKSERGPMAAYEELITTGQLRQDARQQATVAALQRVYTDLVSQRAAGKSGRTTSSGLTLVEARRGENKVETGWWKSIFSSNDSAEQKQEAVKGLYMYGGVGCGKTMLMDMFATSVPRDMNMERIHFHDFMLEVHELLQEHRETADPLSLVAKDIASKSKLLCLDELFVNDIADATILHRLFDQLWSKNVTLVATSNRHPDALYEGGLQRQLFLPFIDTLKKKCVIHDMDSERDYRKLAHHASGLYFTSDQRESELESRFIELTNKNPIEPMVIEVEMGRRLKIGRVGGCIAYATFAELCDQPLGAADYMALSHAKHTLALSGVPIFDAKSKTSAYRFVTLIDILYENKVRLLCSAEGSPEEIFAHVQTYSESKSGTADDEDSVVDDNLGFVKDRTISRLIEMQSNEYLVAHASRHAPELILALKEEKEARSRARYAKR
ncbi:hypothetical protein M9434_001099 [Picochlorum sp. BPE23]|nr:hypothetical protein M9434_001099 [Picochlorum sp. BPE23]KAI8111839.1 hypothetical protein M9435_004337 [Picochlorum sp. BPE23]